MKHKQIKTLFFLMLFSFGFYLNMVSQSTVSKQISTFNMEAPQLQTHKKIWVYLPKSYQESKKKYTVIYMHDAQNLFDSETSYAGEWKVDEYLDSISNNKTIVIGIEHGGEKRMDELTPYSNEKYGGGNGDAYLEFLVKTLKPYVDKNYRTLSDKENTIISGSSLGGLISFYALVKYPDTFGKAGVFSPAFWINDKEMFQLVEESQLDPDKKFFFLVGSEEGSTKEDASQMVSDQHAMAQLLIKKGVKKENVMDKVIPGGKHNENLWSTHFPEVYQWLIKN